MELAPTLPPLRSTWVDVVFALIVREFRTRTGSHWLGYLTSVAEPALHVLLLIFLFGRSGKVLLPGIDMPVFFTVGVAHFFYFRIAVSAIGMSLVANRPLLFYRQVQPLYALLARTLVEFGVHLGTVMALIGVGLLCQSNFAIIDLNLLVWVNFLLAMLSLGIGGTVAVISQVYPHSRALTMNIMRGLFYVSCVFYPFFLLPPSVQPTFAWNPLMHALELVRSSLIPGYNIPNAVSVTYLECWVVGSLTVMFVTYRACRKYLLV